MVNNSHIGGKPREVAKDDLPQLTHSGLRPAANLSGASSSSSSASAAVHVEDAGVRSSRDGFHFFFILTLSCHPWSCMHAHIAIIRRFSCLSRCHPWDLEVKSHALPAIFAFIERSFFIGDGEIPRLRAFQTVQQSTEKGGEDSKWLLRCSPTRITRVRHPMMSHPDRESEQRVQYA